MMFQSTLPAGAPDLMRASAFRRERASVYAHLPPAEAQSSRLGLLGPSMMQDLQRFETPGRQTELLEVMAACIRHGRSLLVHLQIDDAALPLTVFPTDWLFYCPMPVEELLAAPLGELEVLSVEPPVLRAPSDTRHRFDGDTQCLAPLGSLLWELALRGSRDELLPEIAGTAAYRIAPGANLHSLKLGGSIAAAVHKLQRQTCNLGEISRWPGFDRERAMRMLNGLYLQAGLMISRTHPAAINDAWGGAS